jgi:hypothetical protein
VWSLGLNSNNNNEVDDNNIHNIMELQSVNRGVQIVVRMLVNDVNVTDEMKDENA